jgi:hypothetical protein
MNSGDNFGTGYLLPTAASSGSYDILVAKYNASGTAQWTRRYGAEYSDFGYGIATDAAGNVIVVGEFSTTVDFGGGVQPSVGGQDGFAVKFAP